MSMINIIVLVLCIGIVGIVALRLLFRVNTDLPSAGDSATELIARVGGADRIRKEADLMFQQFGVTNQTFFLGDTMLGKYPTIASLGKVDYIMPGAPAHIKIRVGTHLNGYIVIIVDTNTNSKFVKDPHTLEIAKDSIFVSR